MDFENKTPTHKKFGVVMDEIMTRTDLESDEPLPFAALREMLHMVALLVDDAEAQRVIVDGFDSGVELLERIARTHPDFSDDIHVAVQMLAGTMMYAANEIACQDIEEEKSKIKNLAQFKQQISGVEATARAAAITKCKADTEQDLRITQLAKIIVNDLERSGHKRYSVEAVKGWISPVVPEYVKKGGRPSKK